MNMGVENRLARRPTAVGSDVESRDGGIGCRQTLSENQNQGVRVSEFLTGHGKPVGDVSFGNDQHVTGGNRIPIFKSPYGVVFCNDSLFEILRTEAAIGINGIHRVFTPPCASTSAFLLDMFETQALYCRKESPLNGMGPVDATELAAGAKRIHSTTENVTAAQDLRRLSGAISQGAALGDEHTAG